MEKAIVILATRRSHYSAKDAALESLTVGDLISYLQEYDEDSKVVFSNDDGYTYGKLNSTTVDEIYPEE